jgi:hypothetical protein
MVTVLEELQALPTENIRTEYGNCCVKITTIIGCSGPQL